MIAVAALASRGGRMIGRAAGAAERLVEVGILSPRVPVHWGESCRSSRTTALR